MKPQRPLRVAIVGGGCAGMATAFELSRPEHEGRYQVTLFQQGWRLGGKGASGRGAHGRIEEHGLHLWLGWYENAFAMMRETYRELGVGFASWRDAFVPASHVVVAQAKGENGWDLWSTFFPPLPGEPGDAVLNGPATPQPMLQLVRRGLTALREALAYSFGLTIAGVPAAPLEVVADQVRRWTRDVSGDPAPRVVEALGSLLALVPSLELGDHDLVSRWNIRELMVAVIARAQQLLRALTEPPIALPGGVLPAVDLGLTIARGILAEGLDTHPLGFDAIDDHDFAAWLRIHGAAETTLGGATVRGFYSLAFSFIDGEPSRPSAAAGRSVRLLIRLILGYRGAIFFKMVAGMGDVIFAPLFQALENRGVRFEFFHRLRRIGLAGTGDHRHVASLDFDVQATTVTGAPYQPLVAVRGLPCWPAEPLWEQLARGDALRADQTDFESPTCKAGAPSRWEVGRDFDLVVLAVGPGAVREVAAELIAEDPRWRAMDAHMTTVATQSFQLWLRKETADLGWHRGPGTLSAYAHPFDTWAEMSHTLAAEAWPSPRPRSAAYFCNVLREAEITAAAPDVAGFEARVREGVRRNIVDYLRREISPLWPRAVTPEGDFDWSLLHGASSSGPDALESQYYRGNVRPTERYVLCPPGTPKFRISPLDPGLDNFTVCGDWTENGLDLGCVESAVVSGKLAAHALSRRPALADIAGYDGP